MNIYAGKTSTLSSCCFDGSQAISAINDHKFCVMTLKAAYKQFKDKEFITEYEGNPVKAKVVKLPKKGHKMYFVKLVNGKTMVCTDNHIHLTQEGEKETVALLNTDSIQTFSSAERKFVPIESISECQTTERFVYCLEMSDQSSPYFTLANGISTHNCRLRSDKDNEYFNSFGSGGTKIGSVSVTTINLPRLAYNSSNKQDFLTKLEDMVVKAAQINHIKRYVIKKRVTNGNLPLYTDGFMNLKTQYSTCGVNGVNEALDILGYDVLTSEGQTFIKEMLTLINTVNDRMTKEFGFPHNCEQVPSENSAIKLAEVDKVLGYNTKYDLYSNQFIPLITSADLLDRIKLQGMFDELMTGGAICHLNVDTKIEDTELLITLIEHAVKSGVIYHAINYNIQECVDGHIAVGHTNHCNVCGKTVKENYTRVVGFLTNVKNWHKVRRISDYPHRQFYERIQTT